MPEVGGMDAGGGGDGGVDLGGRRSSGCGRRWRRRSGSRRSEDQWMREEVAAADEVGASAGGGWEGIEEYSTR